jgi:precorrin-6x reductase
VRITAQLIQAHEERHLWSERFERPSQTKVRHWFRCAVVGALMRLAASAINDHVLARTTRNNESDLVPTRNALCMSRVTGPVI